MQKCKNKSERTSQKVKGFIEIVHCQLVHHKLPVLLTSATSWCWTMQWTAGSIAGQHQHQRACIRSPEMLRNGGITFNSRIAIFPSCGTYSFMLNRTHLCSVSHTDRPADQCCSAPAAVALKRPAGPGRSETLPVFSVSFPLMLWEKSLTTLLMHITYSVEGETRCKILTNDGTALRTVHIIGADFHPTVEVHLSGRLHTAVSAEMHTFTFL